MKRSLASILCAAVLVTAPSAFAALGPATGANTAGTVANANTVTVTVPGIVGVDLESNLAWDFSILNPAPPAFNCTQSANRWPISITCSSGAPTANAVMYDPTNNTDPVIGNPPVNSQVTTAGALEALSPAGEKAIWLAFFCSRTGATQPTYTATLAAFAPAVTVATTGFDESNFSIKGAGSENVDGVGDTTPLFFAAGGNTVALPGGTLGTAGATFGWTRADQVVTLNLNSDSSLAQGVYNSTLFFTISKP